MQRSIAILFFLIVVSGFLWAQSPQIEVSCSPSDLFVNSLSASSFDPVNPLNQPLLTTVTVTNKLQTAYRFSMNIRIHWNQVEIINFTSRSNNLLHNGIPGIYTNRDLITSSQSTYFDTPEGDVSIQHVLEQNTVLRDALQSGYFPDGTLTFTFIATPLSEYVSNPVSDEASFNIRIKNINAIFLSYPGKPLGQTPTDISIRPVTFMWNSVNNTENQFRLVIKEFMPNNQPTQNTVETGGKKVFDQEVQGMVYSDFLPLQNNRYYAWQVSTVIQNEFQSNSENLKSEWYVFRFSSDSGTSLADISELMAILRSLNNAEINDVFDSGFSTTGAIFYEGQIYTGADALNLARSLIGQEIEVDVTDN